MSKLTFWHDPAPPGNSGREPQTLLRQLLLEELALAYGAQTRLTALLPKLGQAARSEALREAFEQQLDNTEAHLLCMEEAARALGGTVKPRPHPEGERLFAEVEKALAEAPTAPCPDVTLVAAARKVELHELATYAALVELAKRADCETAAIALEESLADEQAALDRLALLGAVITDQGGNRSARSRLP